jgi:hypothetical protein
MRVDLDRLEALAKSATPGPWWIDEEGAICTSGKETPIDLRPIVFDAAYENVLDATYIAAVDPQTVLALVAELRAARRLIDLERPLSRPHCSPSCPCERNQAWLAYEQVVAP